MKYTRVFAVIVAIVLLVSPRTVLAVSQQPAPLTSSQIEHIRNNCGDTQTAISSVSATDAVAFVNIIQQLDPLSNRLMAPMNSRVALNKLDSVALTKTTVDFNAEATKFQSLYRDYVKSVNATTVMGCYNQPVEFYDNLTLLLQKRALVRASYERLMSLMAQYRSQVQVVEKNALSGAQ